MKILLVGLGDWGVKHLRAWQSLPVELFCSDEKPERGRSLPNFSTTFREFLPQVDGVVIATPGPTHYALASECLEAGKDVFVEKPLALTSDQCRDLTQLAAKRGRILQTGHIFRFDPATPWLRDAVRRGQFGALQLLRGRFAGFKRPRPDGGVTISDAIHFVDLFNFLLDSTPRAVQAIQRDILGRGMDDVSFLSLEYALPRGVVWATVEAEYFTPGKHREVIIVGEALSAVCDYSAASRKITTYENRRPTPATAVTGPGATIETLGPEPLLAELQAFVDSIATRAQPLADGWAGYQALRVLEAASRSARSGSVVSLR